MSRKLLVGVAIIVVAAGFLGFTAPGHTVLSALGLATACSSPSC
jgi:hypothetical protein